MTINCVKFTIIIYIYCSPPSIDVVNLNLTRKTRKYKQHLSEKMSILCNNSIWKTFSNTSLVTNLSNYRLTDAELELLGLGLGFSIGPSKNSILQIISSFCANKNIIPLIAKIFAIIQYA